ncbi:DDE-type integrase/transposase/recombinase [Acidisphaera sp. S103]|uniref:DDE-type integrase/transposase/recombinase n=1 Tax=Acidisphaera sp. S103 TaxID=1747223 RepID=UPI00131D33ED|nr:DDE-type integrase/transposase/recombinase [Acidisphaera sp. S103]
MQHISQGRESRRFARVRQQKFHVTTISVVRWFSLDILVQEKRDGGAAKRFFKRLLQGLQYRPKRLVTDGLRSAS